MRLARLALVPFVSSVALAAALTAPATAQTPPPASVPAAPVALPPGLRPFPGPRAQPLTALHNLSNRAGRSHNPTISASGQTVAVAWEEHSEGAGDIFVAVSVDGGRTYAAPVNVSRSATPSQLPRVLVTPSHVAVAWTEATPTGAQIFTAVHGGPPSSAFPPARLLDRAAVVPDSLTLAGGADAAGIAWMESASAGSTSILKYADLLTGRVSLITVGGPYLAYPTLLRLDLGSGIGPAVVFLKPGAGASPGSVEVAAPRAPGASWATVSLVPSWPAYGRRGPLLARGEGLSFILGEAVTSASAFSQTLTPNFHTVWSSGGRAALALPSLNQSGSLTTLNTDTAGDVVISPLGPGFVVATSQAGQRGLSYTNPKTRESVAVTGAVNEARIAANASFHFAVARLVDTGNIEHVVAGKFRGDGSSFYELLPAEIAATTNTTNLRVVGTSVGAAYAWEYGPRGQEEIAAFADTASP